MLFGNTTEKISNACNDVCETNEHSESKKPSTKSASTLRFPFYETPERASKPVVEARNKTVVPCGGVRVLHSVVYFGFWADSGNGHLRVGHFITCQFYMKRKLILNFS